MWQQHPINVPRNGYRGTNAKRLEAGWRENGIATLIENWLRTQMDAVPEDHCVRVFLSDEIALAIGADRDLVAEIVYRIDGGSGVTIYKGDYDRARAAA